MNHIEKLCHFVLKQIEIYDSDMEEGYHPAEVMAAMHMACMELMAGTLAASGFVVMPKGIDKKTEAELLDELPTIIDENGDEIDLEEDEDDDD